MFSRFGHFVLIIALLAATGSHWIVLQGVAWTTMLAGNLQTSSVQEALVQTFDGKHPCKLCKEIVKGKQTEKKSDQRVDCRKLEFFNDHAALVLILPSNFSATFLLDDSANFLTHTPPVPPPKQLIG